MTGPATVFGSRVRTTPARAVTPIRATVQNYDWGSRQAIPALLGHGESDLPVAELWFGTHPSGPSIVAGTASPSTLAELIAADPIDALGSTCVHRFGPRLPFLLKLLSAERPLSLQVHPSMNQARAGFADESARCVPADAPTRNYRDDNHKPELLCALTEFWALAGFRPVETTLALLEAFAVSDAGPFSGLFHPTRDIRGVVEGILAGDREAVRAVIAAAWAGAHRIVSARSRWYNEARWFLRMAELAPDDPGLLIALLLNLVRLEPGQFIFVPAGQVHAYLQGTGVEIMASSDNVLRCGLTSKHVDGPELVRIADFSGSTVVVQNPIRAVGGGLGFDAPVEDFALSRFDVVTGRTVALDGAGPQIIMCVDGSVTVSSDDTRTDDTRTDDTRTDDTRTDDTRTDDTRTALNAGHAAFVRAGQPVRVSGSGTVFRATTNIATNRSPA